MLKKIIIALFVALPMCVCAQTYKFGTVNSQELFSLMPDRVEAEKKLQEINKRYEDEFLKLQEELNRKYQEVQGLRPDSLPETIYAARVQEVGNLQQRIESFREMAAQDINKQQEALIAPIQQKIMQAINAVGAENKFTYIFDLAYPIVLYHGAPSEDVTPLVKAKLGLK